MKLLPCINLMFFLLKTLTGPWDIITEFHLNFVSLCSTLTPPQGTFYYRNKIFTFPQFKMKKQVIRTERVILK